MTSTARNKPHPWGAALALSLAGCSPAVVATESKAPPQPTEHLEFAHFERTSEDSPHFVVDGAPFCFAGTNNYYLTYQNHEAVLEVLAGARNLNLGVLRVWGFLDRGSLDGRTANIHEAGHKNGVYFQYWDQQNARPAYNDGPDGLERLDFVLHEARRRGLRVIVVLTNNWRDFGGMDQYLVWRGLKEHHRFFTEPQIRQDFRAWAEHLITRKNSIDGFLYRDDPAIFAWELANEPRAITGQDFDGQGWDSSTITTWANEMSSYIKSLDPNHMVSVGDEGFFTGGTSFGYDGAAGVDHEALTALSNIDFGTFHLYPDHWRTNVGWGNDWIEDHIKVGRRLGKPAVLEEYGLVVERAGGTSGDVVAGFSRREIGYTNYNRAMLERGGAGALFWHLAGNLAPNTPYPDYDHFTVYPGDASAALLNSLAAQYRDHAQACQTKAASSLPSAAFVRAVTGRSL